MGLFSHQPAPPLDVFIECLWYSAGDTPQRRREFALPSGRADLVFIEAATVAEAYRTQPPRRAVVHDGRVVAERGRIVLG